MGMKDIAQALGISVVMGYRLRKRGMPIDSVEAARRWRDKNLDPCRRKEWRVDGNLGGCGDKREIPSPSPRTPAPQGGVPLWRDSDLDTMPARFANEGEKGEWIALQASQMVLTRMVPLLFFRPLPFACAALDAGLSIDGAQAQRLAAHLLDLYMTIFGGDQHYHLNGELHHPDSPEFAKLAAEIDAYISEFRKRSACEEEGGGLQHEA